MSNVFSDVNSFVQGLTFSNFNAFNRGNRLLENALQQTHSLRYFKYNLFNYTTIFGNLIYSKTTDPVVNRAFFNGIYQLNERVNLDVENESINGTIGYQRTFLKYYKANVGANLNWSKFNTLRVFELNNVEVERLQTTESFSQIYRASLGTQFKKWPNIEVGYSITLNDYESTTFKTQQPFARLDYFFLDGFSFNAEYDYYNYSNANGTINNEYDFLNASLSYRKKDAKMEYKVGVTNLLDTKSLNDDSFNQSFYSTSQYIVQPRYLIFTLRYNL